MLNYAQNACLFACLLVEYMPEEDYLGVLKGKTLKNIFKLSKKLGENKISPPLKFCEFYDYL